MDRTDRRNLLSGLAAVPAALGLPLPVPAATTSATDGAAQPAPGVLRINPPSHSVTRRG